MAGRYDTRQDITDNISETRSNVGINEKADYGGELAGNAGVDLNAGMDVGTKDVVIATVPEVGVNLNSLSKETYGYDEAESPIATEIPSEQSSPDWDTFTSNFTGERDFTNNDIRTSMPGDNDVSKYSKDTDRDQMDSILDNFQGDRWSDLSLDEQKQSMLNLADYVATDTGNTNPPEIVFSDNMPDGTYGGYSPDSNVIEINENMLNDSSEAADTIAHEMWHAYQEQAAKDPTNPRAAEYQEGFDNYISPEYDFEGYENQMVEAEARDYAQGFKDRIVG